MIIEQLYIQVMAFFTRHPILRGFAIAYVVCLVGGLLWHSLKRCVLSLIVAGRRGSGINGFAEDPRSHLTITFVHGTWARHGFWHRDGSLFHSRLQAAQRDMGATGVQCEFRNFLWSGANGVMDRARASEQFAAEYRKFLAERTHIKHHFVIAHSHGGSVALAALLKNADLCNQVSGLICMATPFLVASSRDRRTRWLLAIGEAVFAFCSFDIALGLFISPSASAPVSNVDWMRILGAAVFAVLISCVSYWMGRIALGNLVPGPGIETTLAGKMLIIRAAGDEASAALGAAYILRWALVRAASGFARLLATPAHWLYELAVFLRFGRLGVGVILVVTLCTLAQIFYPQSVHLNDYAFLAFLAVGYFVAVNIVALVAIACRESVSTVVHGMVSVLVGAIALPFGYDLFLATPHLIVAAEAVPPARNVAQTPQVMQLKLRSTKELQHSVYDDEDTASAISDWIGRRIAPA